MIVSLRNYKLGKKLSMAARLAPQELAEYLHHKVATMELVDGIDRAAQLDVEALERGEPVQAYFGPKVGVAR